MHQILKENLRKINEDVADVRKESGTQKPLGSNQSNITKPSDQVSDTSDKSNAERAKKKA